MQKGIAQLKVIYILVGLIVVGAIAGAYYVGAQNRKNVPTPVASMSPSPVATNTVVDLRQATSAPTLKPVATPTATSTVTPTPTPKVTLKPIILILPTPTPTLAPIKVQTIPQKYY